MVGDCRANEVGYAAHGCHGEKGRENFPLILEGEEAMVTHRNHLPSRILRFMAGHGWLWSCPLMALKTQTAAHGTTQLELGNQVILWPPGTSPC